MLRPIVLVLLKLTILRICMGRLVEVCPTPNNCHIEDVPKLPSGDNTVTLTNNQANLCLTITVPVTVYSDATLTPNNGRDFQIVVYTTTSVYVDRLGFVPKGCTSDQVLRSQNGCKFIGSEDEPKPYLEGVTLAGAPGVKYEACFDGPPQPASKAHPITYELTWHVQPK